MLIKLPLRGISDRRFRDFLSSNFPVAEAKAIYEIIQFFPEHFEVIRYKDSLRRPSYGINWKLYNGSKKAVLSSTKYALFDYYGYYDLLA